MNGFLTDNLWVLLPLAAAAVFLWLRYGMYLRGVRQVSPLDADAMLKERRALLIDVREQDEYEAAHIPRSRNVPLSQLRRRAAGLSQKYGDRTVVVSCRSGSRSARACIFLKKNGFDEVYNLRGGILAWARAREKAGE